VSYPIVKYGKQNKLINLINKIYFAILE
jgi:hypothetical protein